MVNMSQAKIPTTTELDTLATMIHGAGQQMINARDRHGDLVWGSRETSSAYAEMCDGFYDIQLRAPGGLTRELRHL